MDVVLNDLNVDTNVNIENFDCRFVDNMTIAVPIFWNDDGKSIDICCNPKFETTILTMINEPIANSLVENVDPLLRAVPENWIPNMNCYDSVEQQIGKKIILGNSLIVHRVLLYAGQSPTADDYKFAMSDKRCSILMLGDRLGVIPNHFYSYIKQQLEKGVISKKNPLVLSMAHDPNALPIFWLPSEDQFYSLGGMEDKDIVIVRIPNMIAKNYSHLSKYFLSRKEIDQSRIYEGSLWTPKGSNSFELRHASVSSTGYGSVDYLGYKNGINWKYKIPTVSGDCGSVLTISNPSSGGRKIVGIHVVGAPNNGLGASIQFFKEDVEAIFKYFKDINNVPLSDSDFLDNFDPQFKCNNSFHVPFCESPYPKPPKFKSKIVPSPLHHIGVVDGLPADASDRVVDGHLIKPYIIALSKSVTPHVLLDHNFLNLLSNYYTWFLSKRSSYLPDTSRRITTQELISGNPEDIYIRPINRKASLGPPYKWMLTKENPSLKGKQEAFGDSDYLYDTPLAKRILSDFDYAQKKAEEGYRVIKYFEDTEKDEILPVDKVKKGKIRVFSIGNFILYLQEKENFVQFSSWFMHNRIYNESGIGMNVFGEDWHKMIMYLSFGSYDNLKLDLFKALDISKFDGSQDRPIQYAWVTIKCNFFPPSDRHRRYCTAENYLNSFHIDKGVIMERDGGNSSGRSGTGEDNTGVLGLDLAYMAIVLYQEIVTGELSPIISLSTSQVYSFLDEYHANNRCCKYGDDVIMSTAPNWRYFKEYSEVNLIRGLNVIGLKATSDAKGDSFNHYRSISDVTFLKRVPKYSKRHLRYVGCLAISSIMKSVQWLKKKDLPIDEYFRVLDKALMELSLHESKESALLINDIIEGGHKLGYMPIATDMGILQDLCLSRDDYF